MRRKRIIRAAAVCLGAAAMLFAAGCQKSTDDGFLYEKSSSEATILGYEGEETVLVIPAEAGGAPVTSLAADAVPDGVLGLTLPEGVSADGGAFGACSTLRYIFLEGSGDVTAPEGCCVYSAGQELFCGALESVGLYDGALFGVLTSGEAVLLDIPEDCTEYTCSFCILDGTSYDVAYLGENALDNASALKSLSINDDVAVAPQTVEALRELDSFAYFEDSFAADWLLTIDAAAAINAERQAAGLPDIEPDIELTRAARIRAEELDELDSLYRPDGTYSYTALTELGIDYAVAAAVKICDWEPEDFIDYLAATSTYTSYWDEENGYYYERLGLGDVLDSETAADNMFCFVAADSPQEYTNGNLTYSFASGCATVIDCAQEAQAANITSGWLCGNLVEAVADGAFDGCTELLSLNMSSTLTSAPEDMLSDCASLAAVMVYPDSTFSLTLPEGCLSISCGEDSGDGLVQWIGCGESGCVYAVTDRGRAVQWSIPDDMETFTVLEDCFGYPVTYVRTEAVEGAAALKTLYLPVSCGFEPSDLDLFNQLEILVYENGYVVEAGTAGDVSSMYWSIQKSVFLLNTFNEVRQRLGLSGVSQSYEGVRAAWTLAAEQSESYSNSRPDGSSFSTIFDEQYIDGWGHAEMVRRKCGVGDYSDTELEAIKKFMENTLYEEDGVLCANVALGEYMSDSGGEYTVYFYCLGYGEN